MASGIVAGLVAITPAAGHVHSWSALIIGAVASLLCFLAVQLKGRLGYDDSLDAFGVHGVGGFFGAVATGLFCFVPVAGGLLGGGMAQPLKQLMAAGVAAGYAAVMTLILALLVRATIGLRATEEQERDGLDLTIHGERGYHSEFTS